MVTACGTSHRLALRLLQLAPLKSRLWPTTGLQSAQQDRKLPRAVISLFKGNIGGIVVKSSWFMSSKLGSTLFLVSTSNICSRSQRVPRTWWMTCTLLCCFPNQCIGNWSHPWRPGSVSPRLPWETTIRFHQPHHPDPEQKYFPLNPQPHFSYGQMLLRYKHFQF